MKRYLSYLTLSLALLLIPALLVGQQSITSLTFHADPPGLVQNIGGGPSGASGQIDLWYWVVARYPVGVSLPAGPKRVTNTVGVPNLTGANFVALSWQPAAGATGYDVIRLTTPQFPVAGTCTNCVVSSNQAGTSFNDVGGAVVNWPTAGTVFAPDADLTLALNNRDQSAPYLQSTGELHWAPVRSTGQYAYGFDINPGTGFFTQTGVQKSYLLSVRGDRAAGAVATGDSNDALIKATYNNYAANDANFIIRGINSVVNNRSGGTLGILEGGLISASNKSGGTSPYVRGLSIQTENFGTNATEHGGADVAVKNEGAKATTEYGIRVRNLNNSIAGTSGAVLLVTEPALANTGWDYIIDTTGVKSPAGKFARMQSGVELISASGVPGGGLCTAANLGAIYLNHGGGGGTTLYVCEVAGAWAAK